MPTAYSKHGFNNLTYARLSEYTSSSAVILRLIHGYVSKFLQGWAPGLNMFVTLRDVEGNIEICKITDIQSDNLTVTRGQDGTIARNWPAGTLVTQRAVSESLGRVIQKGEFRTIAYNPNGVLTREYPNEKIYQTGGDCERRWWIHGADNKWRLAAGIICPGEYYDGDDYPFPYGFWEPWDAAICAYVNWDYIMFWDHTAPSVEANCDLSAPPFPFGLWDLSGGSLKHDWYNGLSSKVVDTAMRSWNPPAVPYITVLIIGISATLTPSTDPGIGGDTTYVRLLVNATGGSAYFTIASIVPGANPIGTGFLEINLADYGISGTLDSIAITSRIHWKGARAKWECFYIGVY